MYLPGRVTLWIAQNLIDHEEGIDIIVGIEHNDIVKLQSLALVHSHDEDMVGDQTLTVDQVSLVNGCSHVIDMETYLIVECVDLLVLTPLGINILHENIKLVA